MLAKLEEPRTTTIPKIVEPRLSQRQKLTLKIQGRVLLRYEKREGWARPLPIYAAKCSRHGLYEDYPHGWKEELECPKCLLERVRRGIKPRQKSPLP